MEHVDQAAAALRDVVGEFKANAFATSSFQTQSMPFLHLIATHAPSLRVWFLDTGFHFPQTIEFMLRVTEDLGLNTMAMTPDSQRVVDGGMLREGGDTDGCCRKMKVEVLDGLLDVYAQRGPACWVSGVRHDQTRARSRLQEREKTPQGVARVHPMLHWTGEQIEAYVVDHALPRHPLESAGYFSVGCQPCTIPGRGREGRWPGQVKEGCGIHNLIDWKKGT